MPRIQVMLNGFLFVDEISKFLSMFVLFFIFYFDAEKMDLKNKQKTVSVKKQVEPISSSSDSDCSDGDGEAVLSESEQSQTDKPTNPIHNELQNELNKMSFEDIQKLQNKLGLKK